jgi:phosphorylase/glycogen(starch) synthase
LLDTYIGFNWDNALMDQSRWEKLQNIPDHLFWEAKLEMKQRLMALVREYIAQNWAGTRQGDVNREDVIARLRSSTLTIGFARRFAPYKRATLLFSDLERLDRLVNNPRRPVQVIFAGKAHPKDQYGCDLVRQVVELSRDSRFAGRIVFLENYDLQIAKSLVQGVDVWLNTPRRPHEASGTSGQKAGMNAGINLSVADGWWYEGATEGNGWTIGPGASEVDETTESDDIQDASEMYSLLEDAVVPLYYQRNSRGLPERWLTMMRRSLDTALPYFNTHRMVADYFNEMYQPCAERGKKLLAASAKAVRQLAEWKRSVSSRFSSVHLLDITTSGPKSGCIQVGKTFAVKVRLDIGDVEPDELCVELVVGKADPEQQISNPVEIELKAQPSEAGHEHIVTFAGEYKPEVKGNYSYGIRIVPNHPDLVNKFDTGLIIWA